MRCIGKALFNWCRYLTLILSNKSLGHIFNCEFYKHRNYLIKFQKQIYKQSWTKHYSTRFWPSLACSGTGSSFYKHRWSFCINAHTKERPACFETVIFLVFNCYKFLHWYKNVHFIFTRQASGVNILHKILSIIWLTVIIYICYNCLYAKCFIEILVYAYHINMLLACVNFSICSVNPENEFI